MGNISNSDYPVLWQLKCSWSSHQHYRQPLFSNESGVDFEFQLCNNIEDKFYEVILCITYSVVLHVYLRRSQILLTFNRPQVMYSVIFIVLKQKLLIMGSFSYSNSKVQGQALVFDHCQHCFGLMLHF